MLDLANLSNESYAAFILAIVFTIITFAGAIVILRRSFKISILLKVLTTIIFPFIAIFCWIYMIMNTCGNFDVITSLYSSFLITLGFYLIIIATFYLVIAIIKKKKERDAAYIENLENEVENLEKALNEKESDSTEIIIAEDAPAEEVEVEDENNSEEVEVEDGQEVTDESAQNEVSEENETVEETSEEESEEISEESAVSNNAQDEENVETEESVIEPETETENEVEVENENNSEEIVPEEDIIETIEPNENEEN